MSALASINPISMTYNPAKHHRRSIRLPDYDYSKSGNYFITICVKDKQALFGEIDEGAVRLNDAGKMIDEWFHNIPVRYPDMVCDKYIIMPDHIHFILINTGSGALIEIERKGEHIIYPTGIF